MKPLIVTVWLLLVHNTDNPAEPTIHGDFANLQSCEVMKSLIEQHPKNVGLPKYLWPAVSCVQVQKVIQG